MRRHLTFLLAAQLLPLNSLAATDAEMATLRRAAEELNASLPAARDGATPENITVGPGYSWTFHITLANNVYSQDLVDSFNAYAPQLAKRFCGMLMPTRVFSSKGLITRVEYRDRDGREVFSMVLDRASCEGA